MMCMYIYIYILVVVFSGRGLRGEAAGELLELGLGDLRGGTEIICLSLLYVLYVYFCHLLFWRHRDYIWYIIK